MSPRRLTWIDAERVAWRLEVIDRRWVLSRWLPITETWLRVGDFSSRMAALEAAYIGWEGDPNALPGWAVQFLTDTAPDVPRKLAASGYPERHAFIWVTVTTPYEIASILDGDALPTEAPDLPDGVTHLWVGGWYAGPRTLYWRPDHGWSEAYRIPPDGGIELPDS